MNLTKVMQRPESMSPVALEPRIVELPGDLGIPTLVRYPGSLLLPAGCTHQITGTLDAAEGGVRAFKEVSSLIRQLRKGLDT